MPVRSGKAKQAPPALEPHLTVVSSGGTGLGEGAVAMPSERVLLLRVALPLAAHHQRLAAVAYAVEDLVAEPLEALHVALGPAVAAGEYLVAVVRRSEMAEWAARARATSERLVPDVLALPVPAQGSWSVREVGGRVLVRVADGTGFATRAPSLEVFWQAASTPQVVLYGGRLPAEIPISATGLLPAVPSTEALQFDLLQGAFARRDPGHRRTLRRLVLVVAAALAAHAVILAAETRALQRIAQEREAAVRSELAARLPDLPAEAPLEAALQRALPAAAAPGGGFVAAFGRVAEVLGPSAGDLALRNLSFNAADGSLAMTIEAPDLAALQRVETDLRAAGFGVSAGVATTGSGAAEARYVVSGAQG